MKAVVYTRYGSPDVLRLVDVDKPTPQDDEVLVRVRAVSLNASDWEVLRRKPLYSRIAGPFRSDHGTTFSGQMSPDGSRRPVATPGRKY
jgi:NADPH:quinone reductase-like Zn-dependent oxidoreductase